MDKDETSGPKGKSAVVCRLGHEYVKSVHSPFFALNFYLEFPHVSGDFSV